MTKTAITAPAGQPTIEMTREFDAPAELLFRAHVDPELVVRWLGPRRLTMKLDRWEIEDGGAWSYVHVDEDGTEYGFHGVFHGKPSLAGIVQTFEFAGAPGHVSLEKLVFEERDGRTTLRMSSVFQSVEARDAMVESGMESGVNDSMDRLAELAASLRSA